MKLIFLLVLMMPFSIMAQPPKKCNEIQIKSIGFRDAVNHLLDAGYSIEKIDSNFLTVRTEPKSYSKTTGGMVAIDLRIKDSIAIIKGFCGLRKGDFDNKENSFTNGKYYYQIENR